ncbi:HD-GYP domain-containing protein [Rhizobium sp. L245/93]|uniref:HD-GYP domain-containing protein n=1 Tax=Rhizobium sp. L245/93 TaxID=2819998 RepID=UPI001ADCB9FE|nr:HD-GYP domain-containing protein [Rhizobium sp. L245/93]MBO9171735.1 HD-GYP domain-containing protein [Rhizobium sp. L245/93]
MKVTELPSTKGLNLGHRFLIEAEIDANALRAPERVITPTINRTKPNVQASRTEHQKEAPKRSLAKSRTTAGKATIMQTTELLRGVFDKAQISGIAFEAVAPIVDILVKSITDDPNLLISMTRLKSKDDMTFLHSIAVSSLMIRLARYLKYDENTVHLLGIAGLLHDIGKIEIPLGILVKAGALDDSELKLMQQHPAIGHELLQRNGSMPDVVLDVCLHHHERLDGSGYPKGLMEDQISRHARIAAICDVYDALTSARPYRKPWSQGKAGAWMLDKVGVFDRKLLFKFLDGALL